MVAEEDATTNTETAASDVPAPPVEAEQPPFILESDSIDFAKSCDAKKGCLCNVNDG